MKEDINATQDMIEIKRKQLALSIITEAWKWANLPITEMTYCVS